MKFIGPLMIEHRLIERLVKLLSAELDSIKKTFDANTDFIKTGVDFFRTYADRTHHAEGFMRDCTKALIVKHAQKIGVTHITVEVANEGIEQAKNYMAEAMKTGNLKDMIANLTGKGSA